MMACRSPVELWPPSIAVSEPNGYGPGSFPEEPNVMGTRGCDGDTTVMGMPYCGPWTKLRLVVEASMLASHSALCGATGKFAMGVFQTLSAGKTGQLAAPGTGVPAEATP